MPDSIYHSRNVASDSGDWNVGLGLANIRLSKLMFFLPNSIIGRSRCVGRSVSLRSRATLEALSSKVIFQGANGGTETILRDACSSAVTGAATGTSRDETQGMHYPANSCDFGDFASWHWNSFLGAGFISGARVNLIAGGRGLRRRGAPWEPNTNRPNAI